MQDTVYKILSESAEFYRRREDDITAYFLLGHSTGILTKYGT